MKDMKPILTSVFGALMLLFTTAAMAQVNKVPADTRLYLQTVENGNKQARAHSVNGTVEQREAKLFVSCASDADTKDVMTRIKALGAKPQGTIGRYVMVSTPVGVVDQIAAIEGVTFISKSPSANMKTIVSKEVTGVSKIHAGSDGLPQAFTGKNVVVGVLDAGFDFTHPSFKDSQGNLRIMSVYAPAMKAAEGHEPVTLLDGTELGGTAFTTPEEILSIQTDEKNGSHGNHCAATSAGSTFDWAGGMAPDADIVLCPLDMAKIGADGTGAEADEDGKEEIAYLLMRSILYVRDFAQRAGKPYVVSMSLNSQEGPHDGSSPVSAMMDKLALENTNMALASSNEGANLCYINHTLADNDTIHTITQGGIKAYAYTRTPGDLTFQISVFDSETNTETWRSAPLSSANGGCSFAFTPNTDKQEDPVLEDIRIHLEANATGVVKFSIGHLEDGRASMSLQTGGTDPMSVYVLHVTGAEGTEVDLWGDGNTQFGGENLSDYYTSGVTSKSLGDWGTGGNIITVGSWAAKTEIVNLGGQTVEGRQGTECTVVGDYSPFSSYGIDNAGHDHPYVSAPGSQIISALNHFDAEYFPENNESVTMQDANGYTWGAMSGTSMATPTAAGIIALWLEAKPTLTYQEIKETIAVTSNTDEFTEADPIRFGCGKMDAYKGLLHILGIGTSIPELSRHQPKDVTFRMSGGRLFIEGAEDGTPIRIYTTSGRLVASATLTGGSVTLPADSPAGVYAVQVGTLGSTLIRK